MNKYYAHIGKTYRYRNKKDLISDLCGELQKIKKEYMSKPISNPYFFNRSFELVDNEKPHLELWDFQINITDKFEILNCTLSTFIKDKLTKVKYCCNKDSNGELDNIFRNITEFKTFLNGEIDKEN